MILRARHTVGYKHGDKTFYNASHLGVDLIVAEDTPVHAPQDGVINTFFGEQGGQWMSLTSDTAKHRFAHLKRYVAKKGQRVKRGDIIAYTGGKKDAPYSGNSTNPHVHWDTEMNGVFVDPLSNVWDNKEMKLSDFIVDGMPADQRIAALKDQVRRLHGDLEAKDKVIERWEGERHKWFTIAGERLQEIFKRDGTITEINAQKETLMDDVEDAVQAQEMAELKTTQLTEQLKDCGLTPVQKEELGLFSALRDLLRRIIR